MYQILPSNLLFPCLTIIFGILSCTVILNFWFINFSTKKKESKSQMKTSNLKFFFLSLFVSFDPNSSISIFGISELNWITAMLFPSLFFYIFWCLPSRLVFIKDMFIINLSKQFMIALKNEKDGSKMFFCSIFIFFLFCNLLGLVPNLFTPTSHITFNLLVAVPMWTGFFLFGWFTYTNKMFAHLVPLSTPKPLISFMVLIESISTLIRPGTLSIRLMANMVSGHLLLTLMGNSMALAPILVLIILVLVQTLLSMLEMGVGMIQAYVFCMLLTLYSDESDYSKDH